MTSLKNSLLENNPKNFPYYSNVNNFLVKCYSIMLPYVVKKRIYSDVEFLTIRAKVIA